MRSEADARIPYIVDPGESVPVLHRHLEASRMYLWLPTLVRESYCRRYSLRKKAINQEIRVTKRS
jgi:hypothetical protein